jgi:phosphogluconate dehydratase
MSGASGAVPAAIHVTPEVSAGGPLARVRTGDLIRLDATSGALEALVPAEEWSRRENATADLAGNGAGTGRELFSLFRTHAAGAEQGGGLRVI